MKFNYIRELNKVKEQWEKEEKIMLESGMSIEDIEKLKEFDFKQFKGNRNFYLNKDYTTLDDDILNNQMSYEDDVIAMLDLIEQIEDKRIYENMKKLNKKDLQVLSLHIIEQKGVVEIAQEIGVTHSAISERIDKIKKLLK